MNAFGDFERLIVGWQRFLGRFECFAVTACSRSTRDLCKETLALQTLQVVDDRVACVSDFGRWVRAASRASFASTSSGRRMLTRGMTIR